MEEQTPRAGVVVVHWGKSAHTMACLRSVAASTVPAQPLVVVDNGMCALQASDVEEAAPGAIFIRSLVNLGFAGGSNLAIRRALQEGAEYVLLLNNDALLRPSCLGEMLRVATMFPRVAAVGAKVLSVDAPGTLWLAYQQLTYRAALVKLVGQGELDGRYGDICEVDSVPGCSMMLSRAALEEVGLLDEAFFAYHEDVDWCTAARRKGFRIAYAPDAEIVHHGEGSLSGNGRANAARYLSARNTVLFARKHAGLRDWLRLVVTVGGSLPLAYARSFWEGDRDVVNLLLRGYCDGLLGREVPYRSLRLR